MAKNKQERFENSYIIDNETGCWNSNGFTNGRGYYYISVNNKKTRHHRLSLELKLGREIQEGKVACHTCNNRRCVNPAHLYEGTLSDNSTQMNTEFRHPNRKLTDEQILKVLELSKNGLSSKQIADAINNKVDSSTIRTIVRRETHKHLNSI